MQKEYEDYWKHKQQGVSMVEVSQENLDLMLTKLKEKEYELFQAHQELIKLRADNKTLRYYNVTGIVLENIFWILFLLGIFFFVYCGFHLSYYKIDALKEVGSKGIDVYSKYLSKE